MKHEKEWYTCDRCGQEIKENMYAWKLPRKNILANINVISNEPFSEVDVLKTYEPERIDSVVLVVGYRREEKVIHLCGKCQKEFKRFMRNEL